MLSYPRPNTMGGLIVLSPTEPPASDGKKARPSMPDRTKDLAEN